MDAQQRADRLIEVAIAKAQQRVEAGDGGRNNALNRAAFGLGGLQHVGLSREEARSALLAAADAAGLPKREADRAFASGWDAGVQSPIPVDLSGVRSARTVAPDPPVRVSPTVDASDAIRRVGAIVDAALASYLPRSANWRAWLESRGLGSGADYAAWTYGCLYPYGPALREALASCDEGDLRAAGWLADAGWWWPIRQVMDGRREMPGLLVPIWSPAWYQQVEPVPIGWRYRLFRPRPNQPKCASMPGDGAWRHWPIGAWHPQPLGDPVVRTVICEGEPDWLTVAAVAAGARGVAVWGVPGSSWQGHWTRYLHGDVVVLRHADDAGAKLSDAILLALGERESAPWVRDHVRVLEPPVASDWNDSVQEDRAKTARVLMEVIHG